MHAWFILIPSTRRGPSISTAQVARAAGELGSALAHDVQVSTEGNSSQVQRDRNRARLETTIENVVAAGPGGWKPGDPESLLETASAGESATHAEASGARDGLVQDFVAVAAALGRDVAEAHGLLEDHDALGARVSSHVHGAGPGRELALNPAAE